MKQGFQTGKCFGGHQTVFPIWTRLEERNNQAHKMRLIGVLSGELIGSDGCDVSGKDYIDSL